jgi:hypothetical protein
MFASRRLLPRVWFRLFFCLSTLCLADSASAQGWNQLPFDPGIVDPGMVEHGTVDPGVVDRGVPGQPASDQATAARVLGPQWVQMSRRAGIIFAGTVVGANLPTAAADHLNLVSATTPAMLPTIELTFRVDRAIAGTQTGQVLTIHEWAGASSTHQPMNNGQHVLLFLYAPSRLGLTSPVGGAAGVIILDASGKNVPAPNPAANFRSLNTSEIYPAAFSSRPAIVLGVSVLQLERAIRSARQMMRER